MNRTFGDETSAGKAPPILPVIRNTISYWLKSHICRFDNLVSTTSSSLAHSPIASFAVRSFPFSRNAILPMIRSADIHCYSTFAPKRRKSLMDKATVPSGRSVLESSVTFWTIAPDRDAFVRFAPDRLDEMRMAPSRLAEVRSAPQNTAKEQSDPKRSASCSVEWLKSHLWRCAP